MAKFVVFTAGGGFFAGRQYFPKRRPTDPKRQESRKSRDLARTEQRITKVRARTE